MQISKPLWTTSLGQLCCLLFIIMAMGLPAIAASSAGEDINPGLFNHGLVKLTDANAYQNNPYPDSVNSSHTQMPEIMLALKTDVSMQVTGIVNRVTVRQAFHNDTEHWVNGQYVFPLPEDAAVDSLNMVIGQRTIVGVIQPKQQAQQTFEKAKKAGKQASLLKQHRPNMFTAEVANLGPNQTMEVVFTYQQPMALKNDHYRIRFPMSMTPRYSPRSKYLVDNEDNSLFSKIRYAFSHDNSQLSFLNETQELSGKVSINIKIQTGNEIVDILSDSHQITSEQQQDNWNITLADEALPDRDFLLSWRPLLDDSVQAYMFTQKGKTHAASQLVEHWQSNESNQASKTTTTKNIAQDQYQLLMMLPPKALKETQHIPRELVLVIDVSGSMSGASIVQAKQSLKFALAGLRVDDRFNIIAFNQRPTLMSPHAISVNSRNLGRGQRFIDALAADGGTEMEPALLAALVDTLSTDSAEYLRQVVFVTDGAVSNEQFLFNLIDTHLADNRLFTIGIGSAPNSYFMRKAAIAGKGSFLYIANEAEVEQKVALLLAKLESPVLTDLKLTYADGRVPDYWPATIADLYLNEPLTVSIKSAAHEDEAIVISGNLNGRYWQQVFDQTPSALQAGLDILWANEYVSALSLNRNAANRKHIAKQIEALGIQYHLVTNETSLVAVDVTPVNPLAHLNQPGYVNNLLPAGFVPNQQMMKQMRLPKTATDSRLWLFIGSCLLVLCLLNIGLLRQYPSINLLGKSSN
ncbi:marine proteobacterial sortase target protein [Shewanella maritima]|uniref:marine proteobacterial sortase target protein n=1 Tax=Shewanella maritima TaxID=2520507 RepID=UPI0037357DCA